MLKVWHRKRSSFVVEFGLVHLCRSSDDLYLLNEPPVHQQKTVRNDKCTKPGKKGSAGSTPVFLVLNIFLLHALRGLCRFCRSFVRYCTPPQVVSSLSPLLSFPPIGKFATFSNASHVWETYVYQMEIADILFVLCPIILVSCNALQHVSFCSPYECMRSSAV